MTETARATGLPALRRLYADALDAEIEGWIERLGYPKQFAGMLRYQMGYVDERLRPASHPGKRVRPFLCLAVCEALSGTFIPALPAAAGIELLHNFSLIHDDIEDRDPVRHHRPTVWKVWGEAQAINAGDAMFAVAGRAVASCEAKESSPLLAQEFQETALALTKGQYLDMSFEARQEVTTDEYMQMISLKSAALIAFSTWAGALIGGARRPRLGLLSQFGEELGLALQIYDDIQGIWGDASKTGKQAHTDLSSRKKTYPVVAAFTEATGRDLETIRGFYQKESQDIPAVVVAIERAGVLQASQVELQQHLRTSLDALLKAELPASTQEQLVAVAYEFTGQRDPVN